MLVNIFLQGCTFMIRKQRSWLLKVPDYLKWRMQKKKKKEL